MARNGNRGHPYFLNKLRKLMENFLPLCYRYRGSTFYTRTTILGNRNFGTQRLPIGINAQDGTRQTYWSSEKYVKHSR